MVQSLSWWSYCRVLRYCQRAPPCRRIGTCGNEIRVRGYTEVLGSLHQVVEKGGEDLSKSPFIYYVSVLGRPGEDAVIIQGVHPLQSGARGCSLS